MHAIVSSQLRRYFQAQGLSEDVISHRENGGEQSPHIGGQSGELTERTPKFQVPDLFEDGDRGPTVGVAARDGFEDADAWVSITRAGHRVDDDVRVDEEQLSESLFEEFVQLVGGQVAGPSGDDGSIRPFPISFGHHTEMFADRLSDERSDGGTAALGLLLQMAALLWG